MPNQRKPGQTFIGCQVDEKLLAEIDAARGRPSRSQFVREAIAEKLRAMGYKVAEELVYPPDRVSISQSGSGNSQEVNFTKSSGSASVRKAAAYPKPKRGGKKGAK